jgi:hypothetical protein
MRVIVKLVGYVENIHDEKYLYEIQYNVSEFNFSIFKKLFTNHSKNINEEELNNCVLICNIDGKTINLKKENINCESDIILKTCCHTSDSILGRKLFIEFKIHGYKTKMFPTSSESSSEDDANEENNKDDASEEDSDNASEEDSDNASEEDSDEDEVYNDIKVDLDILKNEDFLTILRIYRKNPELFRELYKFTSSTDVVYLNKTEVEINYHDNLIFIKNLNLGFTDDKIIEALKITRNHINLAIRYLLLF